MAELGPARGPTCSIEWVSTEPTLDDARTALECASQVVDQAIATAKAMGPAAHDDQVFLYDLSHAAAGISMSEVALDFAAKGADEERLAKIFVGRVIAQLGATLWSSGERWGVAVDALGPAQAFAAAATAGDYVASASGVRAPAHLAEGRPTGMGADHLGRGAGRDRGSHGGCARDPWSRTVRILGHNRFRHAPLRQHFVD